MQPHINKTTYSAADIERYHNGDMSSTERHAIEKAALEDPFLSDAIDGYVFTNTPAVDIAFLKQQLQDRNKKIIPIYRKRPRIVLSVAAMAVLLAGFGWLAYTLSNSYKPNIAVHTEAAPNYKQAPAQQLPLNDSISSTAETSTAITNADQKDEIAFKKPEPQRNNTVKNETAASIQSMTNDNGVTDDSVHFSKTHTSAAPLSKSESGILQKGVAGTTFKARVVDINNNAVPGAIVTNRQNKAVATTDVSGGFAMQTADSNVTIAINSVGFQPQQTTLYNAGAETKIVLQPEANAFNEIVADSKSKNAISNKNVHLEGVEPVEGWKNFKTYIDQNLVAPKEADSVSGSKEVLLSFDVDSTGDAENIIVEKPLCASCDSVAVRLIRDGSKWRKTIKKGKAKASIRF